METAQRIEICKHFLEQHYYPKLLDAVTQGNKHLLIDFQKLSKFSPDLATILLDEPEEVTKNFQQSLESFDLTIDTETPFESKTFHIRFIGLPKKEQVLIRNLRSKHLNKLIYLEGTVRQKSDVRPKTVSARFECPSCGNVMDVSQNEDKLRSPSRCGSCGYKGKFRLLSKELVDTQGIVLEEISSDLEGGEQPKRLKLFLQHDLVSPITDKKTNPGTNIRVVGVLTEVEKIGRDGAKLTSSDYLFHANSVESLSNDYLDIRITTKEEKEILTLAKDPNIVTKLVRACAPGIYGHDLIKEAILMQFLGGVQKKRGDGVKNRGDMHILLIGDPGCGKSQLLKRASVFAPKARYVSGKGASGAGLTASVVKDDFMGGWALEAGALVLANRGICCIDELDKMTHEDRSAMHEALEQQSVSVSKANVQATLMCETTVLAAANPKMGRFDPFDSIAKQINLPPALINRFDLIFPMRDIPNEEGDEKLASFVLGMHQKGDSDSPEIETELLRKFIVYTRQNCKPELTDGALDELKTYYVKMRNMNKGEESMSAISLSARQLEALVRMTEANAKMRLSQKATKKDAKRAIELLDYCLSQIGVDPDTGRVDIDRIQTGFTTSERTKVINIREIIKELEEREGKMIPIEKIIDLAAQKGMSEEKVEEAIEKLTLSGDIYKPKRGHISRIV
ncbi:MAG: minichromosome maintenance protein MCM [Candidatus Woesearchaeota archaeon]